MIDAFSFKCDCSASRLLCIVNVLCLLTLVYFHPSGRPSFPSSTMFGCMVCCCCSDVMCFLSEEIYRHISLPDRHNEPPGFPKEKLPQPGVCSVPVPHLHCQGPLHTTENRLQPHGLCICIALNPDFDFPVPSAQH